MPDTPDKSLESWIWDAACSIRGAKDAPKYKEFILPLIFAKRLCDVFDDELNRIAKEVGSRAKVTYHVEFKNSLMAGRTAVTDYSCICINNPSNRNGPAKRKRDLAASFYPRVSSRRIAR